MRIHLAITEIGYIVRSERAFLLIEVRKTHSRQEYGRELFYCDPDMTEKEIAFSLMSEMDANNYSYQTMWFLPFRDVSQLPIRLLENHT